MTVDMHTVVVKMPQALHDEFKEAMDAEGQGVAPGIRQVISAYLREQRGNDRSDGFERDVKLASDRERESFEHVLTVLNSAGEFSSEARYREAVNAAYTAHQAAAKATDKLLDDWLSAIENGVI